MRPSASPMPFGTRPYWTGHRGARCFELGMLACFRRDQRRRLRAREREVDPASCRHSSACGVGRGQYPVWCDAGNRGSFWCTWTRTCLGPALFSAQLAAHGGEKGYRVLGVGTAAKTARLSSRQEDVAAGQGVMTATLLERPPRTNAGGDSFRRRGRFHLLKRVRYGRMWAPWNGSPAIEPR